MRPFLCGPSHWSVVRTESLRLRRGKIPVQSLESSFRFSWEISLKKLVSVPIEDKKESKKKIIK